MLARTPRHLCIECGLPYGEPGFACYEDVLAHGPAYWSDRGILCGTRCATAHFRARQADGVALQSCDCPVSVEDLLASVVPR